MSADNGYECDSEENLLTGSPSKNISSDFVSLLRRYLITLLF